MIFAFATIGSAAFISIGVAGHITEGFSNRPTKSGSTLQDVEEKLKANHGLSEACEGSFMLSSDCSTSTKPEILVWGDSYAKHLVQGIVASNPDAKIIQMTKNACGPFFNVAPVSEQYTANWAKDCLKFTENVRKWLEENNTVKYAVVSSPFFRYLSEGGALLFRSGELVSTNMDIATRQFEKTLNELNAMGVTPIVFSPPPSNGVDLGRCLARAEWAGLSLEECNFQVDEITQKRINAYKFLERIKKNYRTVRLDRLICGGLFCKTHLGTTYIFRDVGHLSREGSAALGKIHDFHRMITDM